MLDSTAKSNQTISPAAEWLLDNFYVIEEHISLARDHFPAKYCRGLPHLIKTQAFGNPRVYSIATEIIAHVDARIDLENVTDFITAYQVVTPLTIGEFWAIPIMLRLSLIENLRRVASRVETAIHDRSTAKQWADAMIRSLETRPSDLILVTADMARSRPDMSNAFVSEICQLLRIAGHSFEVALSWMEFQLRQSGRSIQGCLEQEGQQQAANQVSVSSSIGSLRRLESIDWNQFVESHSVLESILLKDPSQDYQLMDFGTRDQYRHQIEAFARYSKQSEFDIAQSIIKMAQKSVDLAGRGARGSHIGHFLIGDGLYDIDPSVTGIGFLRRILSKDARLKALVFLSATVLLSLLLAIPVYSIVIRHDSSILERAIVCVLVLGCTSQGALGLIGVGSGLFIRPKKLPRLDLKSGIPSNLRTMVVVPTLIYSEDNVADLLSGLEVRFLANTDKNLHFALLTDFVDSPTQNLPSDSTVLLAAKAGIEQLNLKYPSAGSDTFLLYHRSRQWSPNQKVWMGIERKRGKLEALNKHLLLSAEASKAFDVHPDFSMIVGLLPSGTKFKYIITLDTDTQLPRDSAKQLIGIMAHPLNWPAFNAATGLVESGFGVVQPRLAPSLIGSNRSLFSRLNCFNAGVDPYTKSVSEMYQDIFSESSFIGKGIYDIAAFAKALHSRFPNDLILSHDLIEGCHARCALASDIVLYEEHPYHVLTDASRRNRWIRGDWQIAYWMLPIAPLFGGIWKSNHLKLIDRWKIFDNLRRSLVPVMTVILLILVWMLSDNVTQSSLAVICISFLPGLLTTVALGIRQSARHLSFRNLREISVGATYQISLLSLSLVFLLYEAIVNIKSITRSMAGMFLSGKRLLDWNSSTDNRRQESRRLLEFIESMMLVPTICFVIFGSIVYFDRETFMVPQIVLLTWFLSPLLAWSMSRDSRQKTTGLGLTDAVFLRQEARKIWCFFEDLIVAEDHWLPPDNLQLLTSPVIAHRTSPTNIALSVTANLTAVDFGYLSIPQLVTRTKLTFETLSKLERFRGHFFNWYDTRTLVPLEPRYVSTVDSGNLSGFLLTFKQGLLACCDAPLISKDVFKGMADTLRLAIAEGLKIETAEKLVEVIDVQVFSLQQAQRLGDSVHALTQLILQMPVTTYSAEVILLVERLQSQLDSCYREVVRIYLSWILNPNYQAILEDGKFKAILPKANYIPSLKELAELGPTLGKIIDSFASSGGSEDDHQQEDPFQKVPQAQLLKSILNSCTLANLEVAKIEELAALCESFAEFEFDFLYDQSSKMLVIGYNVSDHRCDTGTYDLLASEARLASYLGVAKGKLPQEHWFLLGRRLTSTKGHPTLISWSGSMFEYLMPNLIMPTFEGTILDVSSKTAVIAQIDYCISKKSHDFWGISESGYTATDSNLNYQYRAFGIPGLGFKRGLSEDFVIAPYATMLALMEKPIDAIENLRKLSKAGFYGQYGFFEAVDFTPSRLSPGKDFSVVSSYMSHHLGMSFMAIGFCINDKKMQQRFHSEPRLHAAELLLHERVPQNTSFFSFLDQSNVPERSANTFESTFRTFKTPNTPKPEVHLLTNGRMMSAISNSGGGFTRLENIHLGRWREDATSDSFGSFLYIQDTKSHDLWSATFQPTKKASDYYESIFSQSKAEFKRQDFEIDVHTEITISPEDDAEIRRYTLTNKSAVERSIQVTTFMEVTLSTLESDEAHMCFNNLFVTTEILRDKSAIICSRRPRSVSDTENVLFHLMAIEASVQGDMSYETDRYQFIGRGATKSSPIAMESMLSDTDGSVLDPCVAIRGRILLAPDETIVMHVVTGVGRDRETAIGLVEKYRDRHFANRIFDLAWTHRQISLKQIGVSESDSHLYCQLAGSVIYTHVSRRSSQEVLSENCHGQSALWGYGISGDYPIVLLKISSLENAAIVSQLLSAHVYLKTFQISFDLIILIEDESIYRQEAFEHVVKLIHEKNLQHIVDVPGGIFVRRRDAFAESDRVLIEVLARVVVDDRYGSFGNQMDRRIITPNYPALIDKKTLVIHSNGSSADQSANHQGQIFSNGYGDFNGDGREYLIQTSSKIRTPTPWSNVIANKFFGTVISESGASYTWCENSHDFRLTPGLSDPLQDISGEAFYIRDDVTGQYWSPTPLPARGKNPYLTTHGFGYSGFSHSEFGIDSEFLVTVAIDAPVKLMTMKLRNQSSIIRRISVTAYVEWILGELRKHSILHVVTELDSATGSILARNRYHNEFSERIGFLHGSRKIQTTTCDRTEFIGRNGCLSSPAAMNRMGLSGRSGAGMDPCGAIQSVFEILPGGEEEIGFILGVGRDVDDVHTLIKRFSKPQQSAVSLQSTTRFWNETLSKVQVQTPDESLNRLTNGWLLYQVMSSRLWARSGYYQSSGAYGFRDQLQDTLSLVHLDPDFLRQQIVKCAGRQFREGDVQHWWQPPSGRGVRTHFSDDFLWLPFALHRYLKVTNDFGILDEQVPFIDGRSVRPAEEAYADLPRTTDEFHSIYEHCKRAIKNGFTRGVHGLPLMKGGDWNDGMNRVGHEGKGESVWLAFFFYDILCKYQSIATQVDDHLFAAQCLSEANLYKQSIASSAWDGEWYLRAFYDDGTPLGSKANDECRIDSLPQSWSVLSSIGEASKSVQSMQSVQRLLFDSDHQILKLFSPPFAKCLHDPGYVKSYLPGIRENGGQYTHAAVWAAMAFAKLNDSENLWTLVKALIPSYHAVTKSDCDRYKVEPYVVAADIYSEGSHAGRGGWTWYTGAAGWMYQLILESLLGVTKVGNKLVFKPCVPSDWTEYSVQYQYQ
ncbi:MAG: cyclic beta 1-2 glucan synthetase, partial [Proteobacteria bacterium]|nr:cyclic beta 1-2 glucan synthetase [Pseudomonadota bacterium]